MNPSLATVDVIHTSTGTAVAVLHGELDMSNTAEMARRLRAHLPDSGTTVVDLTGLTYLDSSGLRLLADLAQDPTVDLVVVAPTGGTARQAIAASHLDQHLDVRDEVPGR